ncbi:MAG TPA: LysM domain-containing protein [Myxococcota bacterium]|nr:LysM domain-containing protein [Myxococcota bacterium]
MARARNTSRMKRWQWAIACTLLLAACASPKTKHLQPALSASPPRSAAPQSVSSFTFYEVKRGDTLSKIAARYRVSAAALASWNGISNPNLIRVNSWIRVPKPGSLPSPVPPPVGAPPPTTAAEVFARPSPSELSGVSFPSETPSAAGSPEVHGAAAATNDEPAHRVALVQPQKPGFSFSPELLARARGELERAEERYAASDFEGALARANTAEQLVAPLPDDRAARRVFARAAVVAGMAQAASDRDDQAVARFREALARDPDVTLESDAASPKLERLFEEARH